MNVLRVLDGLIRSMFGIFISMLLPAISFAQKINGWAVGREGTIRSRRDGGLIWEKQGDVKIHVTGVFFLDEKRVGPEEKREMSSTRRMGEGLVGNQFIAIRKIKFIDKDAA